MTTRREIFTLDDQEHAELCAALDALPRGAKSAAVRAGLRLHFSGASQELARLGRENQALRGQLDQARQEADDLRAQLDQARGQLDAQEQASTTKDAQQIRAAIDALRGELLDAIATAALANGHTESAPGQEDAELAARLDAQLDDFFSE